MENIVIFGAGGHAKTVIDVLEQAGRYCIVGLLDGYKPAGAIVYGYPVLGDERYLIEAGDTIDCGFIAVGDNWQRARIAASIRAIRPSLAFGTAIHPHASVARGANIGEGTVVMAGAVVGADTHIGAHSVLYTNASVDHDCTVGEYVSFAPRAATGGGVTIGSYSALAISSSVIHAVSIGEHAVIGAGATVLRDIESYVVAYGTPAKPIRKREAGERYL